MPSGTYQHKRKPISINMDPIILDGQPILLIPLNGTTAKGRQMIIDFEDLDKIGRISWHLSSTGYAVNREIRNGKKVTIRAHRLIINAPQELEVDHKNHNRLDNRKSNLKICSHAENMKNFSIGNGYYFNKKRNRWIAEIKRRGIKARQFKTKEEAIQSIKIRMGL